MEQAREILLRGATGSRQVHDFSIFITEILFVLLLQEGLHQDALGHLTVAGYGVTVVDGIESPNLDGVITTSRFVQLGCPVGLVA